MTISTKGRYGLRLLIDVATHQNGGVVKLKDVAERQCLSSKYLWQVANPLKAAGLLRATRGVNGGFMMAKDPDDITLFDVVTTLEGSLELVGCSDIKPCKRANVCAARTLWNRLSVGLAEAMKAITLTEAMELQKTLKAKNGATN